VKVRGKAKVIVKGRLGIFTNAEKVYLAGNPLTPLAVVVVVVEARC